MVVIPSARTRRTHNRKPPNRMACEGPRQAAGQDNHHLEKRRRGPSPSPIDGVYPESWDGRSKPASRSGMNPTPFPHPPHVFDDERRRRMNALRPTALPGQPSNLSTRTAFGAGQQTARPASFEARLQTPPARTPPISPGYSCRPSRTGFFRSTHDERVLRDPKNRARRCPLDTGWPRPAKLRFPVRSAQQRSKPKLWLTRKMAAWNHLPASSGRR
jgi:hypothetical protein